jgi:hypothetical protein
MDSGTYTCKVSNRHNEIQRKIQLSVMCKYVLTFCSEMMSYISVINSANLFQTGVINIVNWYILVHLLE